MFSIYTAPLTSWLVTPRFPVGAPPLSIEEMFERCGTSTSCPVTSEQKLPFHPVFVYFTFQIVSARTSLFSAKEVFYRISLQISLACVIL